MIIGRRPTCAAKWQSLGPLPEGPPNDFVTLTYVSGSGEGVIWAVPQEPGDISEAETQVFAASYP